MLVLKAFLSSLNWILCSPWLAKNIFCQSIIQVSGFICLLKCVFFFTYGSLFTKDNNYWRLNQHEKTKMRNIQSESACETQLNERKQKYRTVLYRFLLWLSRVSHWSFKQLLLNLLNLNFWPTQSVSFLFASGTKRQTRFYSYLINGKSNPAGVLDFWIPTKMYFCHLQIQLASSVRGERSLFAKRRKRRLW